MHDMTTHYWRALRVSLSGADQQDREGAASNHQREAVLGQGEGGREAAFGAEAGGGEGSSL